jgi:hypothetical protein
MVTTNAFGGRWMVDRGMSDLVHRLVGTPSALQSPDRGASSPPPRHLERVTLRTSTAVQELRVDGASRRFVVVTAASRVVSTGATSAAAATATAPTPASSPSPSDGGARADDGGDVDGFDAVIVATPAPIAASLLQSLPPDVVAPTVLPFVQSQQYRTSLHVSFLVRTAELRFRPKCATIVPRVDGGGDAAGAGMGAGVPSWAASAVAYITFPTGRLESPSPPGSEIVVVYLTSAASEALLPCMTSRHAVLPKAPTAVQRSKSRMPDWMARQLDGRSQARVPVTMSAAPGAAVVDAE